MYVKICVEIPALVFLGLIQADSGLTLQGQKNKGNAFGWAGYLVAVKGDWKFEKEFFCQNRSWASNCICPFCDASKDAIFPYVVSNLLQ